MPYHADSEVFLGGPILDLEHPRPPLLIDLTPGHVVLEEGVLAHGCLEKPSAVKNLRVDRTGKRHRMLQSDVEGHPE
jgi:hypothetical protein